MEPHVGQKLKVTTLALSAVRFHVVALPAKVTCSRRKLAQWGRARSPSASGHFAQPGTEGSDDALKTGPVVCGNAFVHGELAKILKPLGK